MAGTVSEESGVGRSTEGFSSGQRCQSGEALAEWRSSEQVENGTPSTSPPDWETDDDNDGGFHVDDSEVTLNVCLGKQFSGGALFFRGVRCDEHVHSESQPEEIIDYSHVPGRAVLHRGRHRHGARATTSGQRVNLLLWCRSSVFRELKKYQKDFSKWCGECQREKKERQRLAVGATKLELFKRLHKPTS